MEAGKDGCEETPNEKRRAAMCGIYGRKMSDSSFWKLIRVSRI